MSDRPHILDLAPVSTVLLLEDLGAYRRYREKFIPSHSRQDYDVRVTAIINELRSRGVDVPAEVATPAQPPCRLRPLSDHVVVLPDTPDAISAGGIVIPESAKEKPAQGTVLAVGPGRIEPGIGTVVPSVQVGDVVLFGRYSGVSMTLDDVAVLVMREEDVLGVLAPPIDV